MSSMTSTPRRYSEDPVPGDILAALDRLGIEVVRCTRNEAWARCPGHYARLGRDNNTPKWSVNLDTGLHSCFSCGFSGSFVSLVREVLSNDWHDAAAWVRGFGSRWGVRGVLDSSPERLERVDRIQPWTEARLALFTEPPDSACSQRGVSPGSVEKYGVLWDKDRWILPIRDPCTGSLWGYQEKSESGWVSNKPDEVRKSDTLFGAHCFEGTTAVVLESPLDCLRLYTAGIPGGVSSFGVNISDAQLDWLLDRAEVIIFAFDNDLEGVKMSLKMKKRLFRRGRDVRFFDYSHVSAAKDIGTFGVSDLDIRCGVDNALDIVSYY